MTPPAGPSFLDALAAAFPIGLLLFAVIATAVSYSL
jgi:hypothetical protein